MKIGFDIDGVLADFNTAYIQLTKQLTERNLFPPDYKPHCWSYPEALGYTPEEVKRVWTFIKRSPNFWADLTPEPGAATLQRLYPDLVLNNDIYFCTSRPGESAKWQTELWLAVLLGNPVPTPTVLISSKKGSCAKALDLDVYIDDNYDNVWDVAMESPDTRCYLLDREYNRLGPLPDSVTRIPTVDTMFEQELMNLVA